MNTLIIPDGFELVNFRCERFPRLARGTGYSWPAEPEPAARHRPPARMSRPTVTDTHAIEEEPERWDGLS